MSLLKRETCNLKPDTSGGSDNSNFHISYLRDGLIYSKFKVATNWIPCIFECHLLEIAN